MNAIKKTKFFTKLILLVLCLNSCTTDWKAEYLKKLKEAAQPIQEKVEFINTTQKGLAEYTNGNVYEKIERVPSDVVKQIVNALSLDSAANLHPDEFVVLNIPDSSGYHVNDRAFFNYDDDYYGEEYSYYRFFNDDGILNYMDEDNLSYNIQLFEDNIKKPLEAVKFLLVIKDKVLVKPHCPVYGDSFDSGYVLSEVQVFDVATRQLIDTFDVAAENTENVQISIDDIGFTKDGDRTLLKNLYMSLKKNAKTQAELRMR